MIDFTDELGKSALKRIQEDYFLWLTTIDTAGVPQPRPVWFIWDGESFIVYSKPSTRKLFHIAHNSNVAVHFDGGPKGWDIVVFLSTAEIIDNPTSSNQVSAYIQKYREGIHGLNTTEEDFAKEYSVAIRIRPRKLRA